MSELVAAAGIGLLLGVITGMPIGVVNVAIVDAATRGERRFAIGIALGGALADSVHAAVAFIGVGRLVAEDPDISKLLAVIAALAIASYALVRKRAPTTPRRRSRGVLTGLALTLPNPAALGAWVAVAAMLWPTIALAPSLALAFGVGIGSALWFVLLARVIASLPRDHRVARAMPTIAATLLVALALFGLARAFL